MFGFMEKNTQTYINLNTHTLTADASPRLSTYHLPVSVCCVSIRSVWRALALTLALWPLRHTPHTSPQRDRSPSEWSQAVSIHLQMNSALFHQRTPPSPPSLPQPLASSSSSLLLALFFCPFFSALGPLFPFLSQPFCFVVLSLFVPVMKSAITVRTRTTLKYQKPLICD